MLSIQEILETRVQRRDFEHQHCLSFQLYSYSRIRLLVFLASAHPQEKGSWYTRHYPQMPCIRIYYGQFNHRQFFQNRMDGQPINQMMIDRYANSFQQFRCQLLRFQFLKDGIDKVYRIKRNFPIAYSTSYARGQKIKG